MKKIISSFIVIFIIIAMTQFVQADTATVKVTAVRIREEASINSNIVDNIYEEDEVEVLEETGEWYKLKYKDKIGYAKAEFFTKPKETDNSNATNAIETENTTTQNTISENTVSNTTENEALQQNTEPIQEVTEFNVGDTVNIINTVKLKILPSFLSEEKKEIAKDSNIKIEVKLGNWLKITEQNISGWITQTKLNLAVQNNNQETVQEEQQEPQNNAQQETIKEEQKEENKVEESKVNKTAVVIVETARVRKSASQDSEVIDTLDEDAVVTITGEEGKFYQIKTNKIAEGYISKTLVKEKQVTSRSSTEERDTVSVEVNEAVSKSLSAETSKSVGGNDIISFAKQYLGYPYVLGCSSPENGFDCSGFTKYVFGHFGYTLGSTAASQTSVGTEVERGELEVGDLILFYNDGKTKIGHCGIYIGGGDFIHSANPKRGVVIDNLNTSSYYSERFVTARRIIN